jgi:hypothetical protein
VRLLLRRTSVVEEEEDPDREGDPEEDSHGECSQQMSRVA